MSGIRIGRARYTPGARRRPLIVPLVVIAIVLLAPIAVLAGISFSRDASAGSGLGSVDNFVVAFARMDVLRYAWNSVVIAVVYTVPVVASSFFAGYAFARLKARGSRALFAIIVATMLVPIFVYIIPLFVLYSRLGLTNTVVPWLLWGIAGNAFYIFLFRQFFDSFPQELEEAAMIDGLGRWGIITKIVLPNSRTAIATVTILAITYIWGEVLVQSILLYSEPAQTLSVRLATGVLNTQGNAVLTGPTLAAVLLYVLPPIVAFIVFQRQILQGVATSGLK
ncbi:carbohydrate ABC transporter permease [Leifsonia sp. Leaf336]|uniref:carbohydrate ABC transporter permease n=1 Tax=Leifsonia sp. Leaf336 TaxID=1736341 RepID=UPI0009E9FF2A|nr:carbohydrate ABC transporter permease [Leifsonia sp. Leaf336]